MRDVVTPRQLALALGVSESSVKRWCDDGKLEAGRTAGGHRRISRSAAIGFVRLHRLPLADPVVLGLPASALPETESERLARLIELLETGPAFGCRDFLVGLYLAGESVVRMADRLVQPALANIGERYLESSRGVLIEHRASQMVWAAVLALAELLPRPEPEAPLAVGCAPSNDPYQLPSLLVSVTLTELGWQTDHLGPDTPIEVLRQAIDGPAVNPPVLSHPSTARPIGRVRPHLAWLSVTSEPDASVRRAVRELADDLAAHPSRCILAVGGRSHEALGLVPNQTVRLGQSFHDLLEIAQRT